MSKRKKKSIKKNKTIAEPKHKLFHTLYNSLWFRNLGAIAGIYDIHFDFYSDIIYVGWARFIIISAIAILSFLYADIFVKEKINFPDGFILPRKYFWLSNTIAKPNYTDCLMWTVFTTFIAFATLVTIDMAYTRMFNLTTYNFESKMHLVRKPSTTHGRIRTYIPASFRFMLNGEEVKMYTEEDRYNKIMNDYGSEEIHITGQYSKGLFSSVRILNYKTDSPARGE